MPYYTKEQIEKARQIDILTYLQRKVEDFCRYAVKDVNLGKITKIADVYVDYYALKVYICVKHGKT